MPKAELLDPQGKAVSGALASWSLIVAVGPQNAFVLRQGLSRRHVGLVIGVGLGANALVGGSKNTIALQPLSVQGETGVNLALGVADPDGSLRLGGFTHAHRMHHRLVLSATKDP